MSTFAVLLLCIQACLVQNVFCYGCGCGGQMGAIAPALGLDAGLSPCGGALGFGAFGGALAPAAACGGALGLGAFGGTLAPAAAYGGAFAPGTAYGGTGEGHVTVAGELPVAGNTALAGQVPIMGAVTFGGAVPAAGAVSISGKCACGCESPIYY